MPEVLFMFLGKREEDSANARQQFLLTTAAIGAVFAKDGKKITESVMRGLDGPRPTVEDLKESLSEIQRKVLFGETSQTGRVDGNSSDINKDSD